MGSAVHRFLLLAFVVSTCFSLLAQTPAERHFRFTYAFTVREVGQGKPVNVWFPAAVSDTWQDVKVISAKGDLPLTETHDAQYGDAMWHAESAKADRNSYHFEVVYEVTRRERVAYRDGHFVTAAVVAPAAMLQRFREPDALVPTTGRLADMAAEQVQAAHAATAMQKARALYDYVFTTMRYDKTGSGWGRGDSEWACDAKHGNCTDFHSLFASMARSQGIPTRFAIGFTIPSDKVSGTIAGYHCWADFYVEKHWVPIDISEAWKAQAKKEYYFGAHDANRVQFSIGRDLTLSPPQKGKPLNYFVYPYVEVDGAEHINVRNEFAFEDLAPSNRPPAQTGN